ncbi:unnamed protein product [Amoebophrya sp. A120]|nr:unnamed protein product [Amoebophrya sp. A120]|eukprot:GSA120T00012563001.1
MDSWFNSGDDNFWKFTLRDFDANVDFGDLMRRAKCKPRWSECPVADVPAPTSCSYPNPDSGNCTACVAVQDRLRCGVSTPSATTTPIPSFLRASSPDYIGTDYVVPTIHTPGLAFLSETCFAKIRWAASSGKVHANADTWFDGFAAATGQGLVNATMEDFQRYYKCRPDKDAAQCGPSGVDFPAVCSVPPCDNCEPGDVLKPISYNLFTRGRGVDKVEILKILHSKYYLEEIPGSASHDGARVIYDEVTEAAQLPSRYFLYGDPSQGLNVTNLPKHVQEWDTSVDILWNAWLFWNQFRSPTLGVVIGNPGQATYWPETGLKAVKNGGSYASHAQAMTKLSSSASVGWGLMLDALMHEIGLLSRTMAVARSLQTLRVLLLKWPREPYHGFLNHFAGWTESDPYTLTPQSEYSTVDTAIAVMGALLGALWAGNYWHAKSQDRSTLTASEISLGLDVYELSRKLYAIVDFTKSVDEGDFESDLLRHDKPYAPCGYLQMVSDADSNTEQPGTMSTPLGAYNEYFLVAYLSGLKSRDRAKNLLTVGGNNNNYLHVSRDEPRERQAAGVAPLRVCLRGDNQNMDTAVPKFAWKTTGGPSKACLTNPQLPCSEFDDTKWYPPSFTAQFPWFLARGFHDYKQYAERLYVQYMRQDMRYSYRASTDSSVVASGEPTVWGQNVKGKLWGCGAGGKTPGTTTFPEESGYHVTDVNKNPHLWFSLPIMGGYLTAAEAADRIVHEFDKTNNDPGTPNHNTTTYRDGINTQLLDLWQTKTCYYGGETLGGLPAYSPGWCSPHPELNTWKDTRPTSVDWATFLLGFATNFLPEGFFLQFYATTEKGLRATVVKKSVVLAGAARTPMPSPTEPTRAPNATSLSPRSANLTLTPSPSPGSSSFSVTTTPTTTTPAEPVISERTSSDYSTGDDTSTATATATSTTTTTGKDTTADQQESDREPQTVTKHTTEVALSIELPPSMTPGEKTMVKTAISTALHESFCGPVMGTLKPFSSLANCKSTAGENGVSTSMTMSWSGLLATRPLRQRNNRRNLAAVVPVSAQFEISSTDAGKITPGSCSSSCAVDLWYN